MNRTSRTAIFVLLLSTIGMIGSAQAEPRDDVRERFDAFVAAQNAHDIEAAGTLLQDSPAFLWITRGAPIWGRDAALERFGTLYQGTWSLDPMLDDLKIVELGPDVVQLYVPVTFMIAPAGQDAQPARFLLNQIWVREGDAWKIASILPIPVPPS
ncbi:nuclear transport factor 2 family protein [uncultured Paracoccus sp.]|uniref:nuclear transport factor 2 family protein n=1 Tax=uncultured Paracoccus sp. TaxID=189685 RepID=UPI002633964B|nr:nuclear transport factor 2 family protein [uncultured Paracoccus sp.]